MIPVVEWLIPVVEWLIPVVEWLNLIMRTSMSDGHLYVRYFMFIFDVDQHFIVGHAGVQKQ
jgi:hypothetical protein